MAKIKVSILDTRKHIPELNCMSPVYAREIEDKKVAIIIRSGFTVVDASDLTPYGLDPTGEMPKKITRIAGPQASASSESGASSQPGSTSGTESSGGAVRTRRSLRGSGLPPEEESPAPVTTGTTVTAESASGRAEESAEAAMARISGTPVESIDHL